MRGFRLREAFNGSPCQHAHVTFVGFTTPARASVTMRKRSTARNVSATPSKPHQLWGYRTVPSGHHPRPSSGSRGLACSVRGEVWKHHRLLTPASTQRTRPAISVPAASAGGSTPWHHACCTVAVEPSSYHGFVPGPRHSPATAVLVPAVTSMPRARTARRLRGGIGLCAGAGASAQKECGPCNALLGRPSW
jgi:hypothetical protein